MHVGEALTHRGEGLKYPTLGASPLGFGVTLAAVPFNQILVLLALRVDALLQGVGSGLRTTEKLGQLGPALRFLRLHPGQLRLVSSGNQCGVLRTGRPGGLRPSEPADHRTDQQAEEQTEHEHQERVHIDSVTAAADRAVGTRARSRYHRTMASWRVYLSLVLANLFWSGNYVVGHLLAGGISPLQLTAIRWAIAAPFLIALALLIEKPRWRTALREWPMHLLQAALGLVAFCLFSYAALAHTTALNAALVNATNPVLIAVVAALLVRERLRGTSILGLVTSLLGVLLILTHGRLLEVFTTEYNVGGLYMLGAVAVWTAYTILGRTLTTPPVTSAAIQSVMAAVALAPITFALGGPITLDTAGWWGVLYIGIFPSVLSLMLWNISVKKIGAARAGIYLNLMPVFTALLALALGTPITLIQLLGGALVITGVWLTSRPARKTAPARMA